MVGQLIDQVDSVYFLMFPGWETELRGNRWNFAVRWARHKPVVLVIPTLQGGWSTTAAEPRIPNCRILRIQAVGEPDQIAGDTQIQVGQVLEDMTSHGHTRPLLWCYNWMLAGPLARLPAVARLLHATEAHLDMPGLDAFLDRLGAAVTISDLTVAVSDGVAAGLRNRVDRGEILTVTNGCDFRFYSAGSPDKALAATRSTYSRIAIYAGNINARLDFALLDRLASNNPDVLFALFGPTSSLAEADAKAWRVIQSHANVRAPGAVDADRLPDLYAAADVGLIPYRQDPWLVENALPLKALEMGATGLPVVSSLMKPLAGMAAGIAVTSSADEFAAAFARMSRATLSAGDLTELVAVSSANDYDKKFDQIVEALGGRLDGARPRTRVDDLIEVLGPRWFDSEVQLSRRIAMTQPVHARRRLVDTLIRYAPKGLKDRIRSNRLREAARALRGS
jgi:glycosyltransferase involved in cell wall biosynthesis